MVYSFLNSMQKERRDAYDAQERQPYSALVLYDDNIFYVPQLWYLERLNIYHAWPVMKIGTYLKLRAKRPEFVKQFENVYAIIATTNSLLKPQRAQDAAIFEEELKMKDATLLSIKDAAGIESLRVYKFKQ